MVTLTRIYTRTGDEGTTGLVTGDRVAKTNPRIAAIGSVDELNATIGLARVHAAGETDAPLSRIQNDLFDLGADLATPEELDGALRLAATQIDWLEAEIDRLNGAMPPLTSFILPAGGALAAHLHLARAVARRAERDVWAIDTGIISAPVPIYLNRLSDFLFVAARHAARAGDGEVLWQPGANR